MIRTLTLPDQIHMRLLEEIVTGELPPGYRIIEVEIAERFGTSQAPVREALQRLENDGLISKHKRTSAIVLNTTLEDYYELFEIRALIERVAVRRVATTISPEQCQVLQDLIEAMMSAARKDDLFTLSIYDMEFHRMICEWSGNSALLRAWIPLSAQVLRFLTQYEIRDYESPNQIAEEHEVLLEALRAHNINRVESLWGEHILNSFQQLDFIRARENNSHQDPSA